MSCFQLLYVVELTCQWYQGFADLFSTVSAQSFGNVWFATAVLVVGLDHFLLPSFQRVHVPIKEELHVLAVNRPRACTD